MRMARAFIAAVPLALILVAAFVVPFAVIPGTFGFSSWPEAEKSAAKHETVVLEDSRAAGRAEPRRPARLAPESARGPEPRPVARSRERSVPTAPVPAGNAPVAPDLEPQVRGESGVLSGAPVEQPVPPQPEAVPPPPLIEAAPAPAVEAPAKGVPEVAEPERPDAAADLRELGEGRRKHGPGKGHGKD